MEVLVTRFFSIDRYLVLLYPSEDLPWWLNFSRETDIFVVRYCNAGVPQCVAQICGVSCSYSRKSKAFGLMWTGITSLGLLRKCLCMCVCVCKRFGKFGTNNCYDKLTGRCVLHRVSMRLQLGFKLPRCQHQQQISDQSAFFKNETSRVEWRLSSDTHHFLFFFRLVWITN